MKYKNLKDLILECSECGEKNIFSIHKDCHKPSTITWSFMKSESCKKCSVPLETARNISPLPEEPRV